MFEKRYPSESVRVTLYLTPMTLYHLVNLSNRRNTTVSDEVNRMVKNHQLHLKKKKTQQ